MFFLEWWSYEVLVLLSGILPNPKLKTSVLTICCIAVHRFGTRVANELGAGNSQPARLSKCVVIFLGVAEAAIVSIALFCCRNVLAYLFNTDKDVATYVSELVPLLSTAVSWTACNQYFPVRIPSFCQDFYFHSFHSASASELEKDLMIYFSPITFIITSS
ncbi:hypothetical protein KPL70_018879 [Citrus sinensis]|nr:hypothetical protein KPL70_018879 [Citrus sinensis]